MRSLDVLRQLRQRLDLGLAAIIALIGGTIVLVGSVAVFGGATEDVTQHNGQALQDASRLRLFTDHRSHLLTIIAKVLTEIGAVPVLGLLGLVAGWLLWRRGLQLALAIAPLCSLGVAALGVAIIKNIVER